MADAGPKPLTKVALETMREARAEIFQEFLDFQPPENKGDDILAQWEKVFDEEMKGIVVKTIWGPSDDNENPVHPYEKLQGVLRDGVNNWKWPRMWQRFDEVERRGPAYREEEELNFKQPNKNPNIISQRVLVVGGGPVGNRMAIELVMGGHQVTLVEKRREIKNEDGTLKQLGFTNRINRPHMWPFVRNDLLKLNGKDLMNQKAAYPVFTEPETSSIGIDELQCLLIKNSLLLGVDFRFGVGYQNAVIVTDEKTLVTHWNCEMTYDEVSAKKYGMKVGVNQQDFDVIIGCDGPRSAVRDTQAKFFGNVEKRKFMDCVGIVANVRKVSKKRLKEMGFEFGQEPGDMNRTKMVFKEFFGKLESEADADIENLIYYKASTHNYTILVPKRADLIKHGLSGKVYSFHQGREGNASRDAEKAKLKAYCARVLTVGGIPIDPELPNGGFVDVPNDCMAFDFAECWNTKKSMHFNLAPPGYDVEEDGEWEGRKLVPMVALAGDSLLEPFWPMGLGLKRGWQAIMDTNYAVDNLFNRLLLKKRKSPDTEDDEWDWDQHFEALGEQCELNFGYCSSLQVAEELAKGEYDDKSLVMNQLKKMYKDAEKPMFEVEIDPWTRYKPLEAENTKLYSNMPKPEKDKWMHPIAKKALGKMEWYKDNVKPGAKSGEVDYKGKELISVNGRVVGGFKQAGTQKLDKDGNKKKPAAAPTGARGRGRG